MNLKNSNNVETVSTYRADAGQAPQDALNSYKRDGVVCLKNAIGPDWLDVIEDGIVNALSGGSTNLDVVKRKSDKGSFSASSQAWQQVPAFKKFIFESNIADLAWPFLESKSLTLYYDFLLIKEANSNNAKTPWHQDHAYYPLRGTKVINCWVALDPIPIETALRFYAGSHLPGEIYQASNFSDIDKDYLHVRKDRLVVPDIDNNIDAKILSTSMEPGDMLIWSSHTFHSAPGNTLDHRRAAFSVNWVGDDIVFEEAPALETYLHPDLRNGDVITNDKFPLIRGTLD